MRTCLWIVLLVVRGVGRPRGQVVLAEVVWKFRSNMGKIVVVVL